MKRKFLIAAGLLCLGTSPAFAFTIPSMAPDMAKAVKEIWTDQMAAEQPGIFDAGEAWMGVAKAPKVESAAASDEMLVGKSLKVEATDEANLAKSGPSEAVLQPTSLPAAAAYPPCSRGAGDDHCIQLYERGVRAQLADSSAAKGPVQSADATLAGEMGGTSMPAGAQYTGTGGPLEEVDYPPCSRTIRDRCTQRH
jgi:hypothetical protein